MKKIFITAGAVCVSVVALAACGGSGGTNAGAGSVVVETTSAGIEEVQTTSANSATTAAAVSGSIDEAQAKKIALDHAGLKEDEVTFILAHPDYDDGRQIFDVEFYKDLQEYDYEIDATTGEIVSFDYDAEGKFASQQATVVQSAQSNTAISMDDAKGIALEKAGVSEADATFTSLHYEIDDGIPTWQVDFVANNMEYEFEINADSGAVMEFDSESVFD